MPSALGNIESRVEALIEALDKVLAAPRPRPKRVKAASTIKYAAPAHLSLVMMALVTAAKRAAGVKPRDSGLGWYQLRDATKLTDELLGLALNELLPARVKVRGDGDERIYFLPKAERLKYFHKGGAERQRAA